MSGFAFPELYSWPPFFTRQRHEETLAKQKEEWGRLIRGWCAHSKAPMLTVAEASKTALFTNAALGRALSVADACFFLDDLVVQGYGEWQDGGKERCLVFLKKPEEWADIVQELVDSSGLSGSVVTVYEMLQGDLAVGTLLKEMDQPTLLMALRVLEMRGKAQVIVEEGEDLADAGVKFA